MLQSFQRTALDAPQNVHILNGSVSFDSFVIVWDAMGVGTNLRYQVTLLADDRIAVRDETTLTRVSRFFECEIFFLFRFKS